MLVSYRGTEEKLHQKVISDLQVLNSSMTSRNDSPQAGA